MRTLITGGPRTGKTTLSRNYAEPTHHTDDTIGRGWSEASAEVARWINRPGPWVIEGVAVPRALRKWLEAFDGKPCDELIVMTHPHVALTPGQMRMAKGVYTVLDQILPELEQRGVKVRMW
jgi:hypothetical protein